jgi:hypothetical protein
MDEWQPISEAELLLEINRGVEKMVTVQRRVWEMVKVMPRKWQLHPWGDQGGGFWVVAILEQTVVWFNDIEDGFNISQYTESGVIADYRCNQDELNWTVQRLLKAIEVGEVSGGNFGPPQPMD